MTDQEDPIAALRAALRGERAVPTSRLERLWKTGKSAVGLAGATLGGRLRGRSDGLAAADVAAITRLVTQLGELKGVAMKAGQIMSYLDPTLPEELRGLLAILQTSSPPSPFSAVEATLRAALGDRAEALLVNLDRDPVAVASIGQVHRARLPGGEEVAVKVLHPGVEEALRSDFGAASAGSALARVFAPGSQGTVRGVLDEAREAMLEECDFALEARRQALFARLFADDERIVIPAVEPLWCAKAVLTTRWTPGRSLDDLLAANPSQAERDRLGVALFSFYVGALYRHGVFHADPHPGNYAIRGDGRLIVYDFGCVRSFDAVTVAAIARLAEAARSGDVAALREAMTALGATPPEDEAGIAHLEALVRGFFAPVLRPGARRVEPDASFETQEILRDKRAMLKLGLPGKLLFLLRLRFGLYAVLARLGAVADWAALERGWAETAIEVPRTVKLVDEVITGM